MALSASTVWEIRTAGSDTNGGGFVTGATGSDYSQTDANRTGTGTDDSTTDAVANGTTTITSATANFGTTIVGNIIFFSGGSGGITACWRQVTARTNATTITIDASVAASTGMTMNIGGALLSPALPGNANASANVGATIWIKSGAYAVTSASTNVIAGCFSKVSGTWYVRGYGTARGDLGTPPVLTASGISTFTMHANNSAGALENITFDGGNLTGSRGVDLIGVLAYKVKSNNHKNSGFIATSGGVSLIDCSATLCNTAGNAFSIGAAGSRMMGCVAYDNSVPGFNVGQHTWVSRCIADSNTGIASDGFSSTNTNSTFENCVSYGNGRDGFRVANNNCVFINNIAEDNVGNGFNVTVNSTPLQFLYNGAFSNAVDYSLGTGIYVQNFGNLTYTTSAFTDAANGDFSLNDTSGGGLAMQSAAWPGEFPNTTTTGNLDMGAAQHLAGSTPSGLTSLVLRGTTVIPYRTTGY